MLHETDLDRQRHVPVDHDAARRPPAASADAGPSTSSGSHAFVEDAQRRDVRITQCITDAKGDRSRPPGQQDDPDAYVHVVDRQPRRRGHPRRQAAHHAARRSATS